MSANNLTDKREAIKLKEVILGYNKSIYQGINASVQEAQMVAIIGANGMGKSTLLKSISGAIPYLKGSIELFGVKLEYYSIKKLASVLSFVPSQSPKVKNLSVNDMLATSSYNRTNWLGKISKEEQLIIEQSLIRVGMIEYLNRDISTLSDGEFQRVAIARALVQDSPIILLDEPTAFLDIANRITVTNLLREICTADKKSILFSTHDLQQAITICDKVWILGQEQFFEGSPKELIEKGAFDQMFKDSSLKFSKELLTFL